jgi:hypothetical protein
MRYFQVQIEVDRHQNEIFKHHYELCGFLEPLNHEHDITGIKQTYITSWIDAFCLGILEREPCAHNMLKFAWTLLALGRQKQHGSSNVLYTFVASMQLGKPYPSVEHFERMVYIESVQMHHRSRSAEL